MTWMSWKPSYRPGGSNSMSGIRKGLQLRASPLPNCSRLRAVAAAASALPRHHRHALNEAHSFAHSSGPLACRWHGNARAPACRPSGAHPVTKPRRRCDAPLRTEATMCRARRHRLWRAPCRPAPAGHVRPCTVRRETAAVARLFPLLVLLEGGLVLWRR